MRSPCPYWWSFTRCGYCCSIDSVCCVILLAIFYAVIEAGDNCYLELDEDDVDVAVESIEEAIWMYVGCFVLSLICLVPEFVRLIFSFKSANVSDDEQILLVSEKRAGKYVLSETSE